MSIRYTRSSNSLQLDSNPISTNIMAKPSQSEIEQMIQYARVRNIENQQKKFNEINSFF